MYAKHMRMYVGRTPLHYAALHGRAAAVEELIKQGAAHAAKDNRGGYTPLHLAVDAGQCEVISRLFELGADLEAVSTKGWTPLALANMKVSISNDQHNNSCTGFVLFCNLCRMSVLGSKACPN